jgi:hypothetical protein
MDTYVLTPLQRTTTSVSVPGTVQMDSSIPLKYCEGISTIVRYCTSTGDTSSTVLQQHTSLIQCMVSYEYNTEVPGTTTTNRGTTVLQNVDMNATTWYYDTLV